MLALFGFSRYTILKLDPKTLSPINYQAYRNDDNLVQDPFTSSLVAARAFNSGSRVHNANIIPNTKILYPYLPFDVVVMAAALMFTHIFRHDNRSCQTECRCNDTNGECYNPHEPHVHRLQFMYYSMKRNSTKSKCNP